MKKLITAAILMILSVSFACAQSLSSKLKDAYKTDDTKALTEAMQSEKMNINSCIILEERQYSLLDLSIKSDAKKIFDFLITQKQDLNKICEDKTAMMHAAKNGRLEMVKKLLSAGANINTQNNHGKTALDYAAKYGHTEIEAYIKSIKK
jgi:uncharacterized protein